MKFHSLFLILCLGAFSCSNSRYKELELPEEYYIPEKTELKIDISSSESLSGNIVSIIQLYSTVEDNVSFDAAVHSELDLINSITGEFRTGDFPDIFFLRPSEVVNRLIDENRILDLRPLLEEHPELEKEFIYSELWSGVSKQDKVYGLPLTASYGCMVVNKNIYQLGIDVPGSIEDFYAVAGKLKDSGYSVFRTSSLGELSQLVSSLIEIFSGGLDFETDQSDKIKNGFVMSVNFLRDMIGMDMFEVNHLVQNNLFLISRRQGLFHFITGMSDKFLEDTLQYEYHPFPASGTKKRSMIFTPGNATLFVSNDPGRSRTRSRAINDFIEFLLTSKSRMYYTSRKDILNLSDRAGNRSVYHPVTDLLSCDGIRISLSPDQFYSGILEQDFILGIAELLISSQDPEKWWNNHFPQGPETSHAR